LELKTDELVVSLDETQGALAIARRDGRGFALRDAAPRVDGDFGVVRAAYRPRIRRESFADPLGQGERLIVDFADLPGGSEIQWRVQLYRERPWVSLTADLRRPNGLLTRLSPLAGSIVVPGGNRAEQVRAFVHSGSQMPCGSCDLGAGGIATAHVTDIDCDLQAESDDRRFKSEFLTALSEPTTGLGMALGFYSLRRAWCSIRMQPADDGIIHLLAAGEYYHHNLAADARRMLGESLLVDLTLDPLTGLENYARAVEAQVQPRFNRELGRGFHNPWFYLGNQTRGEHMLHDAARLAECILSKYYGISVVMTGLWQKQHPVEGPGASQYEDSLNSVGMGEELVDENRYPDGGLERLEREMRATGTEVACGGFFFQAGSRSTIRRRHPDRVINGRIDYTHPACREWLRGIIEPFVRRGARYLWADFNDNAIYGVQHDPTMVKGFENTRAGMQVLRDALGPDGLIGTYTSPTICYTGIVDRMRMGLDMVPFNHWSSLREIVRNMAAAYFFHQRMWMNDPDPIFVCGESDDPATLEEARIRLALGTICGSVCATGERFYNFTPQRMRLLTTALPSAGIAARPLDLMRRDVPEEFLTVLRRDWDAWRVVSYLNLNEAERTYPMQPDALELDSAEGQLVFDFWTQRCLGALTPGQTVTVPARTCRVLLIRDKKPHPWVLSTDMHLLQGAVDLAEVSYDAARGRLAGVAVRHPGAEGRVVLQAPAGFRLRAASAPAERVEGGPDCQIFSLALTFDQQRQPWEATFEKT